MANKRTIIEVSRGLMSQPRIDERVAAVLADNATVGAAAAAPTTGTYAKGEKRWNTNPTAGGFIGWVCVTAGTPGTWKGFGAIEP